MDLNLYYTYVSVLAFFNKLKYSSERTITLHQLEEYFVKYMNRLLTYELNNNNSISIYDSNSIEDLRLDELYPDIFFYNDKKGCYGVYSSISSEDIYFVLGDLESRLKNGNIYYVDCDDIAMLKLIGATESIDELKKLIDNEKENEKVFYDYLSKPNDVKLINLKKRMLNRALNMFNFSSLPYGLKDSYLNCSFELEYEEDTTDTYPVNENVLLNYPYEEEVAIIESFDDLYLNAIFGNDSLSAKKLSTSFYFLSECNNLNEINKDVREFKNGISYFYLKYINNLDIYSSIHDRDESLVKSRKRLIYALDDEESCLFIKNNLDSKMREAEFVPNDYEYVSNLKLLMSPFMKDLFMFNSGKQVTQKLLLMKTYYEVTHDEEFRSEFDSYELHPLYQQYHKEIFGLAKTKKL